MSGRLRILIVSALTAVIVLPLSLKPRPGPEDDPRDAFREIVGGWGYIENTDSPLFWRLAADPALLLEEGQVRQSRPVFVAFGAASRWFVSPFVTPTPDDLHAEERIGYTFLNLAILAATITLMASLLRRAEVPPLFIVCGAAVLAVNRLTRTFFWTAHTQILTLLAGTLLTYVAFQSVDRAWRWRRRLLAAVGLGIMCLASGLFFVGLPILWVSGAIQRRRAETDFTMSTLGREALLGAAFFTPVLIWVAIANVVTGSFYSHETAGYRQFIWVIDALDDGWANLASTTAEFLADFAGTLASAEMSMIGALAVLAATGFLLARRWETRSAPGDVGLASLTTLALLILFLAAMGFYRVRITAVLIPPAVILILSELTARGWATRPVVRLAVAIGTVAWVALHLGTPHPYA